MSKNISSKFKKTYALDTSVILSNVENIKKLSDGKQNLIVITETVLDEVDKYKVGSETINYQSREFGRLLSTCEPVEKSGYGILLENDEVSIFLINEKVSLSHLSPDEIKAIKNDDRIIESYVSFAKEINKEHSPENFKFVSNDVLFRVKVRLRGYECEPLFSENYSYPESFTLRSYFNGLLPNKTYYKIGELNEKLNDEVSHYHSVISLQDKSGNPFYLVRIDKDTFKKVNTKESINLFGFSPRNIEQRILWNLLLTDTDIIVVEGIAGTSKTLSTLLCALKQIQTGKFHSITYIRKTVISGDKLDDLGFLPGDLNSKLAGYLWPLRDNIEQIVRKKLQKKKKRKVKKKSGSEVPVVSLTQEEIEEAVKEFENKWNIRYEYLGHLRGRNLEGIIIIDEAQNFSVKDITTILSRIVDGSKVFIIGSLKQIDNPRLDRKNNALSFMLSKCGNFTDVSIQGIRLTSVHRGKICNWIEEITKKR